MTDNNSLEIESTGAVVFDRRIVGEYDFSTKTLVLNAAWCRLAGLGLLIQGDSSDRRKVLLDRSNSPVTGEEPAKDKPEVEQPKPARGRSSDDGPIPEDGPPKDPYAEDPWTAAEKERVGEPTL